MDGRGRWLDNRFIERLWRSVKQEDIYVQDYGDGLTAQRGLARWFGGYNTVRPHQALSYATPGELYHSPGIAGGLAVEAVAEVPAASRPPFAPSTLTGRRDSLRAGRRNLAGV